jgi:hypothetical protein
MSRKRDFEKSGFIKVDFSINGGTFTFSGNRFIVTKIIIGYNLLRGPGKGQCF